MTIGRTEQTTAVALSTMAAFQVALAVGAPWGRAAYGGTRPGRLPLHLRAISAVAALGYGAGAVLIVRGAGSVQARGRAFTTLSAWMTIGTIVNAASPSPVERAVWTPVTAATTVLAWRSRARLMDLSPTRTCGTGSSSHGTAGERAVEACSRAWQSHGRPNARLTT